MAVIRGENEGSSWVASGDLSGAQWRLVALSGVDVYLPTSGVACKGVLTNKPRDNEHASVVDQGHIKVTLAQSMGQQQAFMAGNNGFATLATSGGFTMGYTETAGNSGEIVSCFIHPGYGARTV